MKWSDVFGVAHSKWEYRYRYDQTHCAFVVELCEGGFHWEPLRTIRDNKHQVQTFVSREAAATEVRRLGVDHVYALNKDQERTLKVWEPLRNEDYNRVAQFQPYLKKGEK